MGSVRPWQIVLFAVALIALGVGMFTFLRNPNHVDRADSIFLVDTSTGKLFEYEFGGGRRGVLIPTINPETGERTLYRAHRLEDGTWELDGRDVTYLYDVEDLHESFDLEARLVTPINPDSPTKMSRRDVEKHLGR